jgi:uncharacterized protein (DUF58 family)
MLLWAGSLRGEIALSLVGAVFLVTLTYCFAATLLLALLCRKKAASASARMLVRELRAGEQGELLFALAAPYHDTRFLRLPGIIVRYEMNVATKDDRRIRHVFDPDVLHNGLSDFPVPKRGAYYSHAVTDRLLVLDALGFFQRALPVASDTGCRLLAAPKPSEPLAIPVRPGGSVQRSVPHFQRTDDLTDHRPYVPGDDPRRINWKLYGHAGDLFVREGEPEPPPHSRLVMLLDTQVDEALYPKPAGQHAVDMLCESALAIIADYTERGIALSVGYTGGSIIEGTVSELAAHLAYPAAQSLGSGNELPAPAEERGVLVLALPREKTGASALDGFLSKREPRQSIDLVFLYTEEPLANAADTCARFYGHKGGVHARPIRR